MLHHSLLNLVESEEEHKNLICYADGHYGGKTLSLVTITVHTPLLVFLSYPLRSKAK